MNAIEEVPRPPRCPGGKEAGGFSSVPKFTAVFYLNIGWIWHHAIMRPLMERLITKQALRATERLTQTMAALARLLDQTTNDIQAVDSEFQEQVLKAVQQTEAYLEQQGAERLKLGVKEAEQNTRALVAGELEARFNGQMAAAVEAVRNELKAERDQFRQELERLRQTASEWESERARLAADCEQANCLLVQSQNDHERALAETDEAAAIALERQVATAVDRGRADLKARWDADRASLVAERNRAQQRLADAASDYETRQAAAANGPAAPASFALEAFAGEVARVERLIQAISQIVEDPDTELSVVIRKNAERAELESYVKGLRFNFPPA